MDIYDSLAESIVEERALQLRYSDMAVLLASVQSVEQAQKSLVLLEQLLENMREQGAEMGVWAKLKRHYLRLCQLAVKYKSPELVIRMFSDLKKYQISTYFGKEAIATLGRAGAPVELMQQVAQLCKAQRGPNDKGVWAAYYELMHVLRRRGLAQQMRALHNALLAEGINVGERFPLDKLADSEAGDAAGIKETNGSGPHAIGSGTLSTPQRMKAEEPLVAARA